MSVVTLPFEQTGLFNNLILDYAKLDSKVEDFYNHPPTLEGFEKQIKEKTFSKAHRESLVKHLKFQYEEVQLSECVKDNIELLLEENTYTVTTGHQLNLCTGPLYFIYKIAGTINLAKKLKADFPEYNFVPIYWMASEDHDFDEINHFHFKGSKIQWDSEQKGAVGRFLLHGLSEVLENIPDLPKFIKDAYSDLKNNLATATLKIVNHLFSEHGLVCLDADSYELKKQMIPLVEKELFDNISHSTVNDTNRRFEHLNYKVQVNPREINLFYLRDAFRERIILEDGKFKVNNTNIEFDSEEIQNELNQNPERFSPNVILRPVYQEMILPNLAYLGGPGEINYWLQLQSTFEKLEVQFPILMLRDFVLYVNKPNQHRINKLDLRISDLFKSNSSLKDMLIGREIDYKSVIESTHNQYLAPLNELEKIIPTGALEGMMDAERQHAQKQFKRVQNKLRRFFEHKYETQINQLLEVKEYTFPSEVPQERKTNFLNIYIDNRRFIDQVLEVLNPLEKQYKVILES